MKRVFCIILFCLVAIIVSATGIEFSDLSFKKVIAQAAAQNKLIFIDAYTTWCGPCRMMDGKTFKDAEVGAFYNEHFINLKMDMESGIGKSIAARYAVKSYPTFLFINGDGDVVHTGVGYQPAKAFIAQGRAALKGAVKFSLQERYDEGERGLEFMFQYITELKNNASDRKVDKLIRTTVEEYKDNWHNPYIIGMLVYLPDLPDSKVGQFLINNHKEIIGFTGIRIYMSNMQERFLLLVDVDLKKKKHKFPDPQMMNKNYKQYAPTIVDMLSSHYEIIYAMDKNDISLINDIDETYLSVYGSDSGWEYLNFATFLFEQSDDRGVLQSARTYAGKAISLNRKSSRGYLTLSAIYEKMGEDDLAMKAKAKGKELVDAQGEKPTITRTVSTTTQKVPAKSLRPNN